MITRLNDGQVHFGIAEHGVYYITGENLYYVDDNNLVTSLGSVNFMNEQKVELNNIETSSLS